MTKKPPDPPPDPENPMTAAQALQAQNFPAEKVIDYARQIARRRTSSKTGPDEDLVSYLVETGLRYAIRYDPDRTSSTGSYTFSSYLYDIMEKRVPDFFRRQAEGHADHRKGREAHLIVTDIEPIDPDELSDDFLEKWFTPERHTNWKWAAEDAGIPLVEHIAAVLDNDYRARRKRDGNWPPRNIKEDTL